MKSFETTQRSASSQLFEIKRSYQHFPLVRRAVNLTLGSVLLVIVGVTIGEQLLGLTSFADSPTLNRFLSISSEDGFAEGFLHGMSFVTAACMFLCYRLSASHACLAFAILYAFIWFDDRFQYHELVGLYLTDNHDLPLVFGLRERVTGSLIAWSAAAIVLVPVLFFGFRQNHPFRNTVYTGFGLCFTLLLVAGVGFDVANEFVRRDTDLEAFTLLEDGAEMLAVSLATAFSFLMLGVTHDRYGRGH